MSGDSVVGVAIVALLVGLIAYLVVRRIARSRAGAAEFYSRYAAERSLAGGPGRARLPPVSRLLRRGVRRYAEAAFSGTLPGGIDGALALYTYETGPGEDGARGQTSYHRFTVVIAEIPGADRYMQELTCQRRGFSLIGSDEDASRPNQRLETESEAVYERFEIYTGTYDDPLRVRRILSPTFIDWLSGEATDLAFELEAGTLVCNVEGHARTAEALDRLCEASARIADRIRAEADESARG